MFWPMVVQRPLCSQISDGMMPGKQEFLADLVHLLAHDGDDLVDRSLAEEEIRVNAGAELADVSGAEEEFMTGDFGVCRSLAECRDKKPGPTMHCVSSSFLCPRLERVRWV